MEEKGTLIVLSTKKGFAAKIAYTKTDGKAAELPVVELRTPDPKYNNTQCVFRREAGRLVELKAYDGTILFAAKPVIVIQPPATAKTSSPGPDNRIPDSFSVKGTFLPKDTQANLSIAPDNFALKLNKAPRFDERMQKFQFFKRDRKGENYEIKANYGDLNIGQIADRELENAKRLLTSNFVRSIDLTLDWRMIQGLGIESVYETSITLHHTYGIPYVPASSLKGMVRSWIITEVFGTEAAAGNEQAFPFLNAEFRALTQNEVFCKLFGCPKEAKAVKFQNGSPVYKRDKQGKLTKEYEWQKPIPVALKNGENENSAYQGELIFFDAFPLTAPKLDFDVMNPHYAPYYSDKSAKTAPADYHYPIPVHFITVANTSFRFIIGAKKSSALNEVITGKTIFQWLTSALTSHGIGAKTAVGYGFFSPATP